MYDYICLDFTGTGDLLKKSQASAKLFFVNGFLSEEILTFLRW